MITKNNMLNTVIVRTRRIYAVGDLKKAANSFVAMAQILLIMTFKL